MIGDELGFMVVLRENGAWKDDWDGVVHTTVAAGRMAHHEAEKAGYEARLVRLVELRTKTPSEVPCALCGAPEGHGRHILSLHTYRPQEPVDPFAHTLAFPGGPCREGCPHPDHAAGRSS